MFRLFAWVRQLQVSQLQARLRNRQLYVIVLSIIAIGLGLGIITMRPGRPAPGRDGDPHAGFVGSGILRQLVHDSPQKDEPLPKRYALVQFDEERRVLINARATLGQHLDEFTGALEGLGMQVLWVEPKQNLVTGYMPIEQVAELPRLAHFSAATPGLRAMHRTGSVTSQGDGVIQSNTFRSTKGVSGAGITVGVISGSVNRVPPFLGGSQALLDLPMAVNVLKDFPPGPPYTSARTDEGRAMLEIIHDIAPGAKLAFSEGASSPQIFANSIGDLATTAGARVIVDDIGFANSPFFNDGVIAQAVDKVVASGVFYASAAGNDADHAWADAWRPTTATVGGITGTFHNLNTGPGVNVLQDFTIPPGQMMVLSFQWDSAYLEGGSPLPGFQVPNDLAVIITDATDTIVPQFFPDNVNPNTDEAFEQVIVMNPSMTKPLAARMSFQLVSGPAPTTIKWVAATGGGFANPKALGQGNTSTIYGQAAARTGVAVGAVRWNSPTTPEPFTGLGGDIPILFDTNGTRLSLPELRTKPDLAAPDGVSTTFPPASGLNPFLGTSAAAPHVAGAVALLLQPVPNASPADVLSHLKSTAKNVGAPGADSLSGAGLIQLVSPLPLPLPPPSKTPPTGDEGTMVRGSGPRGQEGGFGLGRSGVTRPGWENGEAMKRSPLLLGPFPESPGSPNMRVYNISGQRVPGADGISK